MSKKVSKFLLVVCAFVIGVMGSYKLMASARFSVLYTYNNYSIGSGTVKNVVNNKPFTAASPVVVIEAKKINGSSTTSDYTRFSAVSVNNGISGQTIRGTGSLRTNMCVNVKLQNLMPGNWYIDNYSWSLDQETIYSGWSGNLSIEQWG